MDSQPQSPTNLSGKAAGVVQGEHVYKSHEGEHHEDFSDHSVKITPSTYLFAFCAAVNSCNLGYDIGVNTNAGPLVQSDLGLEKWQRELFIGSLNFWSMFGSLFAHWISDRFGRRRSFIAAAVTFIVGVLVMSAAESYNMLMFGRVFVGLGVGFGLAIDPLYIAEISPASHRGELVTWSEIAANIGIVLGFTSGLVFYGLDDDVEWRVLFLMGIILPVVVIALVLTVMPESPRWLVANGRGTEARVVLQQIYPPGFNIDPVVQDINEALERERVAEKAVGWAVILFPTPAVRRMLMVGVGIAIAQQAVGIDAIQNYLIDVLEQSGVESGRGQLGTLIVLGLIKLMFILVGGKLFDRRGRRPLLLWSLGGMIVALLMVSCTFLGRFSEAEASFAVFGLALYLAFFSIGMGPGSWLIPSEVFPTSIRAKAISVATFSNRLTATLMSSTFLTTGEAMGWAGFFFLLAVVSGIVAVFLHLYLPETKGRSLEDMSIYFAELTGDQTLLDAEDKVIKNRRSSEVEIAAIKPAPPSPVSSAQGTMT